MALTEDVGGLNRLLADREWVLAHFTLAADLTALREECRFAAEGGMVVARYLALPFAALSFFGEEPPLLAQLAARLVGPGDAFYLLVNEQQAKLVERAFAVEQVQEEWQMLFVGDPARLEPGAAVPLDPDDLPAMQALAANAGLTAFEQDPFRHGPAFGVWEDASLVAMGGTHLRVPGAAEIGNIATRTTHRRKGLARQVVAALVQAHAAAGRTVFLMAFQTNEPAIRLYDSLGFVCRRPMFLMRCRLR